MPENAESPSRLEDLLKAGVLGLKVLYCSLLYDIVLSCTALRSAALD